MIEIKYYSKIKYSHEYNDYNKIQNISFKAGLTPKMMQEIQNADVLEISKKLEQKGIPNDFKGNKVIAWCCDKTVEIFEHIKKGLPQGIFVDDFTKLNVESQTMYGFCNLRPTELYKNSNEIVPSRTIFFNTFDTIRNKMPSYKQCLYDWSNINNIADEHYNTKHSATNHFLDLFIHEFSHVSHEGNLLDKINPNKLAEILEKIHENEQLVKYRTKYGSDMKQICTYAANTPLDAIACDMSKIITGSLENNVLLPTNNPFINTPYDKQNFLDKINILNHFKNKKSLNDILRNFWNGKFDHL